MNEVFVVDVVNLLRFYNFMFAQKFDCHILACLLILCNFDSTKATYIEFIVPLPKILPISQSSSFIFLILNPSDFLLMEEQQNIFYFKIIKTIFKISTNFINNDLINSQKSPQFIKTKRRYKKISHFYSWTLCHKLALQDAKIFTYETYHFFIYKHKQNNVKKQVCLIIIVLMKIIFYLLLALTLFPHTILSQEITNTDFEVSLKSDNFSQRSLPQKFECSCQLIVYPVYDSGYSLIVNTSKIRSTHVKLWVKSTQTCRKQLIINGQVIFILGAPKYYQGNNQITQTYFIGFITQNTTFQNSQYAETKAQDCFAEHEKYFYRQAYLINQTKLEQDEYSYSINLPLNAIAFTQLLAFILLFILSQNIKYRRFTPFTFNFIFSILYVIFLLVTAYVSSKLSDQFQIFFWFVLVFSVIFATLYFIDITSIFLNSTPLIIVISIILSIAIAVVDVIILPNVWYINNLLGMLVAGALIKFIVIKKIKTALLPLLFLWIFFILRQFPLLFKIQEFHEALQIKIIPLFLQLPSMINDDQDGYICSAFGTSKIITMGLIMNYCVRVDLFLSSRFYTTLCTIFALVCLSTEYLILMLFDDLPVLQYSSVILYVPLMLVLILMLSAKRGEWAVTWHGSFHDMAVDRKSIKRQSSYLDSEQLDRNIEQLRMDPSLLSSE